MKLFGELPEEVEENMLLGLIKKYIFNDYIRT